MAHYKTNQRRELAAFLMDNHDNPMSASQISEGVNMSISAVYRNLEVLENEGKVTRSAKDGCREILYRYTASEECSGMMHLCCTVCGRTFHMNDNACKLLIDALSEHDGFEVDISRTVLHGVCSNCRK